MKIGLLSLSIPYETAATPIIHIRIIRVLFLRIYDVNFNIIEGLGNII
jgi:hypothetical protein